MAGGCRWIKTTNNQLIVGGNSWGDVEEEARWVGSVGLDVVPLIWPAS
jgi:hypothetical protein